MKPALTVLLSALVAVVAMTGGCVNPANDTSVSVQDAKKIQKSGDAVDYVKHPADGGGGPGDGGGGTPDCSVTAGCK